MTVQKRSMPLPIGGGLAEGTNDVLFDPPAMREIINAQIDKEGRYSKRNGATALAATLPSTSTYGEHSTIAEHDGRVAVITQAGTFMHDEPGDTWVQAGHTSPRPSRIRVDTLFRPQNSSRQPESVIVTLNSRSCACYVWSDADTLEGFYMFTEVPTSGLPMRILSGPTQFSGTRQMSSAHRLTAIGTTIYCVAKDNGTDAWYSSVNVASGWTFAAPASVNPGWGSGASPLALMNDGTSLYVLLDEGVNSYSIRKLNASWVEQASEIVAREALDACIVGSTIAIICATGQLDTVATTIPGPPTSTVVTTPGASGPLFAGAPRGTISQADSSGYFLVWERGNDAAAIKNTGVVTALVSSGLAVTYVGTTGTVRLLTRAAYRSGEGPIVGIVDDVAPDQFRMGYLAKPTTDSAGAYVLAEAGRFGQDVATRNTVAVSPSLVYDSASRQWIAPFQVQADSTTVLFTGGPVVGTNVVRATFLGTDPQRNATANGLLCFGGGTGVSYMDGLLHAEVSPSPIGVVGGNDLTDLSGIFYTGAVAEQTRSFAVAVRWRDAKGNLHRSIAFKTTGRAFQNDADPDDEAVRYTIPRPFPLTVRGDRSMTYELEVYGLASDGVYYLNDLVTPEPHPTWPGIDFFVISDNASGAGHVISGVARPTGADYIADMNFGAAGTAYWADAGELAHVPPPCVQDLASTQARLWILSAENGRLDIIPSKLIVRGFAPEFATDLRVILPDEGGECTALASLTDKVVIFKERKIYVLFGDPGDNTGAGNTLEAPRLIASDVGCAGPATVVEGPFGVVFKSITGSFHLLSPGLEVSRIGAPVLDSLGSYDVSSGVLVADKKEVRWSLRDTDGTPLGRTIVWDYESNAWMTYESLNVIHACTRRGQWAYILEGGTVAVQRDTWSTALDSHASKYTSAWIKTAGVGGFQRAWKTLYTLRWITGIVTIRLGYDYNPTYTDVRTWSAADMAALDLSDGTVTLTVHHTIQKCRAFRFQIEETTVSGQDPYRGQGFALLGVQMEYGAKRGSFAHALPAAARK